MNIKLLSIIAIVATGLLSTFAIGHLQQVSAKASDNANGVAHSANTNQGYMEGCKEGSSADDCATDVNGNGQFTSRAAHDINGPD